MKFGISINITHQGELTYDQGLEIDNWLQSATKEQFGTGQFYWTVRLVLVNELGTEVHAEYVHYDPFMHGDPRPLGPPPASTCVECDAWLKQFQLGDPIKDVPHTTTLRNDQPFPKDCIRVLDS